MSLEERCSHEIMPADRKRGQSYFLDRRVALEPANGNGLVAAVRGSREAPYQVRLDWSHAATKATLLVSCDCPRFADFVLCKHVWATILAFDRERPSARVPGFGPLEVDFEIPGEPAWLDDSDDSLVVTGDDDDLIPPHILSGLPSGSARPAPGRPAQGRTPRSPNATWKHHFEFVRSGLNKTVRRGVGAHSGAWRKPRQAWYRLNVFESVSSGQLYVDLYQREAKKNGELGKLKRLHLSDRGATAFPDLEDRELLSLFRATAATPSRDTEYYPLGFGREPRQSSSSTVPPIMYEVVLPRLCATGRFGWVHGPGDDPAAATQLAWDDGEPWQLVLRIERHQDQRCGRITGRLERGHESCALSEPIALLASGAVVFPDTIARLNAEQDFPWVRLLRNEGTIEVPEAQIDRMLEELWNLPALPQIEVPPEWQLREIRVVPRPQIALRAARFQRSSRVIEGEVSFEYDGRTVPARHQPLGIVDIKKRRVLVRDIPTERAALAELSELGMQRALGFELERYDFWIAPREFSVTVERLIAAGWKVEAEGHRLRRPGGITLRVTSDIDWFELWGEIDFGDVQVGLPELLAAVRRGERFVRLGDGTQGMLPEEWLRRYTPMANLVHEENGDSVRFLPSQAVILDALLAVEDRVDVDRKFAAMRERLRSFERIEPASEPRGFSGKLRSYQRDGLGWLRFLQDFRFGGCLADDMGLGKTIQVLALLQLRRLRPVPATERRPSLVVVPRSLVYNWIDEASRFTPKLRVLSYTGLGREELLEQFDEVNVVVTTYGTLRRDILMLKDIPFDYVILDEAQAIKNAASQTAKVCRLIRAEYRLALTGTPVENHLGELWSIFEFLNPGMLGRLPVLKGLAGTRAPDTEALATVAQALKPFILRRRKEQVLKDLPEKTEQTLFCELDRKERQLYDELRDHYRTSLMQRIAEIGLGRSKIQVLEALLRLRQAACHPGLIDKTRSHESSAKLDTLVEHLHEVIDEGHKALVFSQFTSLLAILRTRLDRQKIPYEYLDGQTRRRKEKVNRFQTDDDCQLFLISLKAGGLGLNLTAADYVFILDPWWNPAVEAQAVDRAHRIGQTRPVFAYRLICRGTVEEKIMELQRSKRELADAILSADQSMIRTLTAEDLQLLLS